MSDGHPEISRMRMEHSMGVTVDDVDLGLRIGRSRAGLSPSQAFAVAEKLIRAATKAIVIAADAAMVREAVRAPERFAQ